MTKQFARYESYKDSGVEWLGSVPNSWILKKAKYVFIDHVEKNHPNAELLSVTQDHGVIPRAMVENRMVMPSGNLHTFKHIEKGDFAISLRSFEGGFEFCHYDGIISPAYTVLKNVMQINEPYFKYLFKSHSFILGLQTCTVGIREGKNISYEEFAINCLPMPDIQEQQKIADFLDKKTAQIDEAIAQKEKMIELLKEYRQITINNAVTKGLGPNVPMKDSGIEWLGQIPTHWEIKKIKFILKQMSVKVSAKNSNHKYIGMENIESWSGKYIETSIETEGDATQFHENCVLFGKLRPYLAKVFLSSFDGICSSEFMVFDILQAEPRYILNLLLSKNFINIVDSSTYGSKMPRANPDYINNLLVPSPSKKEQKQIADFLDKKKAQVDEAISLKQSEIEKLKEYKTTLIDSAVTGKIKV